MNIISHRGWWLTDDEKNSKEAFVRAKDNGFGIELDLRDYCGEVVVSHDIATRDNISFDEFLSVLGMDVTNLTLAINIKSDGLQDKIYSALLERNVKNYFVFDMSFPDSLSYLEKGMNVYIRRSEYEAFAKISDNMKGVWLDQMKDDWCSLDDITSLIKDFDKICFVSPELHGRNKDACWRLLKSAMYDYSENLMICTDHPDLAEKYFNG